MIEFIDSLSPGECIWYLLSLLPAHSYDLNRQKS